MTPTFVILSVLAGIAGLVFSPQASVGASIVGVGCLFAIWARIAQADKHHSEIAKQRTDRAAV